MKQADVKNEEAAYREVTFEAIALGIVIGIVLAASMTYAGLVLGFTIVGSEIAAILGWGVLRGILGRSTIVENNVNQTVASAVNASAAGVIFTVPVLYLRGIDFEPWPLIAAAAAGATLGVAFIIPVRKQMIEIERLRFPSGTAVATILKAPGAGVRKARLLGIGFALSATLHVLVNVGVLPDSIDLGPLLGLPLYVPNVWALSLLAAGAGFISGPPGLAVLAGGLLANWVLAPLAVGLDWIPPSVAIGEVSSFVHVTMSRPLGIGMLVGGAIGGIVVAFPAIRAAFRALRAGSGGHELSLGALYASALGGFVALFLATHLSSDLGVPIALAAATFGTAWLWLAGIIVAECTGMTDWSPISGLALVAVTLLVFLTSGASPETSVTVSVLVGAAVCVATSQCADMMQDLKTGHLVGARPIRQQVVQLASTWIGPIVSVGVVALLWNAYGFGPEELRKPGAPEITAPQAQALAAAIDGVLGGAVPVDKYAAGTAIGALLAFSPIHGLGVLVGLSMYLPLLYVLPYGAGCLLSPVASRMLGERWTEESGVPIAAGLIVGEAVVGVAFAIAAVGRGLGG